MRFMKEFAIAAMLVICTLLLTGCFAVDVIGGMMLAGGDDEVSTMPKRFPASRMMKCREATIRRKSSSFVITSARIRL